MNFRTTIILLVIVVAGGLYIGLVERKQKSAEDIEKASKKVVGIENLADKATKIRIQAEAGEAIVCERNGEGADAKWTISKPRKLRADKSDVRSILSDLEFLEKKGVADKPDLAKYGLDKPRGSIAFWIGKDKKTLLIGSKAPDGNNVWAKMDGVDQVYLVGKSIFDKAKKGVNDLRDRKIFSVKKDDVTRIVIKPSKGAEIECAMEATGWALKKPVADQANKKEVDKIIDKLKDLTVDKEDFIDEEGKNLAKYGLDKPQLVAEIYQGDVAQTMLVGKVVDGKSDKVYAKRKTEPAIVELKKDFLDDVKKKPQDLRDKKLARFEKADVTAAEIKVAGKDISLKKEEGDWKMSKPKEMKADTTETENLFGDVSKLEVAEFVNDAPKDKDLAAYGLDKPQAEIALTLKDGKAAPKLLVGAKKKDSDQYYMKRDGQAPVFLVDAKDLMEKLGAGYLTFRKHLVLEFTKVNTKKLTVKRKDKTFVCEADPKEAGKWNLTQPIKAEGDKTDIDNILWDISYLRAKTFVAENPKDLKPYGLDAPAIVVTVVYDKEMKGEAGKKDKDKKKEKVSVTKVLMIGKKAGDAYYAKLGDSGLVFKIGESYVKNLQAELASKTIMETTKANVKAVTLAYAAKTVKFEKKDDKWQLGGKNYDKDKVDEILDKLSSFRAKSIAAYSAKDLKPYGLDKPYLTVGLAVGDGEKTVMIGAKKGDDAYYVKAGGKDFIYVADKADVEKLEKEKPEAPKPVRAEAKKPAKTGAKAADKK